jgi:flagellar biosynthesis protein FlhF
VQAKAALAEMKTILPKKLLIQDETDEQSPETQVSKEWLAAFNAKFNIQGESENEQENARQTENKTSDQNSEKELKGLRVELNQLKDLLQNQISSMAWMDVSKTLPNRARLLKSLFEMGVSPAMGRRIAEKINFTEEFSVVWRKALAEMTQRVLVPANDIVEKGGVFALVGPTGVGKTTTIAKMAARYALNHGTKGIALITTDNYRIGAQEQLRTYGRILGAPVRVVNDAADLRKALKSLYDKQLILIDTAGMSQRDMRLTEQFAMLSEGSSLIKSYLVVSAAAQVQVLDETVQAYKKAVLDGCIISKVDESCSLGGVLSAAMQHQLPIAYLSDGQRVPEDLHMVGSVELVRRAVSALKKDENKLDDEAVELMLGGYAANEH